MKTHDTTSKKIYCLECREPITSREDLYVVLKDGANRAIHPHCHRKLDEMGLINPSIKTSFNAEQNKKQFRFALIGSIALGIGYGLLTYLAVRFIGNWIFTTIMSLLTIVIIFLPFVGISLGRKRVEKLLWNPFERHLPATCRECHEEIPPNHKNCPACGWKYVQPGTRLTNKVSK